MLNQLELNDVADEFVSTVGDRSNKAANDLAEDLLKDRNKLGGALAQGGTLCLALSFVLVSLNAMRAGLLSRFMGILGIIVGVLLVLPLLPGRPERGAALLARGPRRPVPRPLAKRPGTGVGDRRGDPVAVRRGARGHEPDAEASPSSRTPRRGRAPEPPSPRRRRTAQPREEAQAQSAAPRVSAGGVLEAARYSASIRPASSV